MRVLTVRQPWAWQIIHQCKDVENRTRNLAGSYRGPVAIHAAKRVDEEAMRRLPSHPPEWVTEPRVFWTGEVLGVVDLVDVHEHSDAMGCHRRCDLLGWVPVDGSDASAGDWAPRTCSQWAMPGHHHLVLANPRPLHRTVPATGRLGLWRPDPALLNVITTTLGEA